MRFRHDTVLFSGTVQGVGFRPALHRLAGRIGLTGTIVNCSGKVMFEAYGCPEALETFYRELDGALPPGSAVTERTVTSREVTERPETLTIDPSRIDAGARMVIPHDLAICPACAAEIADPANRRFGYAYNSCADCGPRYSIMRALPYDRERGSMDVFPLCPDCQAEYDNPADRRFHVENISCPVCGPKLNLPVAEAAAALRAGNIVAFQSVGAFQLLADPCAVARLRRIKGRPDRPFALLARDLDAARKYCVIPPEAEAILCSSSAPIVILKMTEHAVTSPSYRAISPDTQQLGIMLPNTPLHRLLFAAGAPEMLIATSFNQRGLPAEIDPAPVIASDIADLVIHCDRKIVHRNDDSVVADDGSMLRRARGFAPDPIPWRLPSGKLQRVAAIGAELKNAFCLADRREAVLSPHLGDLENLESIRALEISFASLRQFLAFAPEAVAVDLHPDLLSTRFGETVAKELGVPLIRVQHHHAHAAAVMAETGLERALALVFDGTGFGPDGTVWGAELLDAGFDRFERLASFRPVPLPGGDLAVERIERQLIARVPDPEVLRGQVAMSPAEFEHVLLQCRTGLNAPRSRAAGRLFDAFACMTGVFTKQSVTYEGQAAIRLESAAGKRPFDGTFRLLPAEPFRLFQNDGLPEIDWSPLFADPMRFSGCDTELAAAEFHTAVAAAAVAMIESAGDRCRDVVLAGGVFQNRRLIADVRAGLEKRGSHVHLPYFVPPNDGGIAFGQAAVALCHSHL